MAGNIVTIVYIVTLWVYEGVGMSWNLPFVRFCKMAGGSKAAAEKLCVSYGSVMGYRTGRNPVPPLVAKRVDEITEGAVHRLAVIYPDEYQHEYPLRAETNA